MSEVKVCNRGSHNVLNVARTALFKALFWKDNPAYFYPDGIWVFSGAQGSGKTLSAVLCAQNMLARYPRARLVSNMDIRGVSQTVEPFEDYSQLQDSNGTDGIVFLLDEIHILWNSLESKQIPITEMATFCQMRKDRRVIIGTSQVYGRIAKPIREQLKYLIICHNYLGLLQVNQVTDPTESVEQNGHILPAELFQSWFFHSPELYKSYETLNKIQRVGRSNGILGV